jgi:O-antigen ligase
LLGAALLLLVAALPLATPSFDRLPAIDRAVPPVFLSGIHRLAIWRFTADRIAERPILGWGMDASRALPGGDRLVSELAPGVRLPAYAQALQLHPHDAALQWRVEIGLPGTVLCLAILAFALWRVGWRAELAPGRRAAALAWAAVALVVASLSYGIWQAWWLSGLWLTAALLAAGPEQSR